MLVQQGFGEFGLAGDLFGVLHEFFKLFALLFQFFRGFGFLVVIDEGFALFLWLVALAGETFGEVLLLVGEFAGDVAHLAHVFGKLAGAFLPEIFLQIFKLLLRSSAGSEGA